MVLLATRIGLWLLFGTALRKLNASVDYNSKMVLVVVGAVGSLYFLSFPLLVLCSQLFAEYWRHRFITFSCVAVQLLSIMVLTFFFIGSNPYTKASTLHVGLGNGVLLPDGGMHKRRSSWGEKVNVD